MNDHFIKCNILLSLEKLNSKELYLIQLTRDFCKPTSQIYFEKHFKDCVLDWKYIYILPRIVTSDPYTRYFQYKVLNNVLYLNEKIFSFGIFETSQCPFCNQNKETVKHLFCHCFLAKALWNGLNTCFENQLSLYDLMPQAAFSGFMEKNLDILESFATGVYWNLAYYRIIYYWCLKYTCINHFLTDLFA